MKKRYKAELRAGIFLNLGLLLGMVALFLIGSRFNVFSSALHYNFAVPNAEGLLVGAKVFVAGVSAGKVNRLTLDEKTRKVLVQIDVAPGFSNSIREDSFVELRTQGILGDKAVMIAPGSLDKPIVPAGGMIKAKSTSGLQQLAQGGADLIRNLDQLVQELSSFSGKMNKQLDLKKVNRAMARLDSILAKLDRGDGTLGALLNDPTLYDDAKSLVGQVNQNRIVRNLIRKSIRDAEEKQAEKETQPG
ncbi:MAG: hypothetical protein A2428_15795 [Bdellovibrionales bacterium RIFOXYC1_FULL_54_43]|nr:MAG: hypothetical protein A2428_15795 [Bdellovibrionales bacterium RIFOXYC1_FULL_54_43]OFZ85383.1 MAG: hypothetical protein A2603_00715 [Bdellovibrionales bacterium RIFOXYD1_FULL_55_31]